MLNRFCPVCNELRKTGLFQKEGYEYVRCQSCNHIYVDNPNDDTRSNFNPEGVDIKKYKDRHKQIINLITDVLTPDTLNIAEIGSGIGNFGYLASKYSNKKLHYTGYEPSVKRCDFSKLHGLNVKNALFDNKQGKFDVVIADNVLEHVLDPRSIFKVVSNSLDSGGIFVIIVPNRYDIRRFMPKWRRRHYWQPSCHINHFSFGDLKYLSQLYEMEIHSFGMNSLCSDSNIFLKVKTLLDRFGLHIGGLYLYAIKK